MKSTPALRFSLRTRLLGGVALVALLVGMLLAVAHHFLSDSAARMEASLSAEVQPLVRVNHLQAKLHDLRSSENELARLDDYFAVNYQITVMRKQMAEFSLSLKAFAATTPLPDGLDDAWQRYADTLERVMAHALKMEMVAVDTLLSFEATPRYRMVGDGLRAFADRTEAAAKAALDAERVRQTRLRGLFALISAGGLGLLLLVALWWSHGLARRLGVLQDAAQRLAAGEAPGRIVVRRERDELDALAAAFTAMRDQILVREGDLRTARDSLEGRVAERTRELSASNLQLRHEAEERMRAEGELRLLREAVEQSPVGIMITDTTARILYVNPAFLDQSGYRHEDLIGRTPATLKSGLNSNEMYRELWQALLRGETWSGDIANRRADGEIFWEHERISPVCDAQGQTTHYLAIREDITERRRQEEKIRFQAQYDHLTRLPNRALGCDRLAQAIAVAGREQTRVAVMFVDLDDFKKVNDTLGHEVGDRLLVEAARRFADCVRNSDTVARLGGDEFLVLLPGVGGSGDADPVAEKIIAAFATPFTLDAHQLQVTPSIGIALWPEDAEDVPGLLRSADLAMYDAKESGRNTWRYFNHESHERSLFRMTLERDLRQALLRGELALHYQPLIDIAGRRLRGAEALLRWNSPHHGLVPPDRFIPLAEQSGLILELGDWVMRTACAQAAHWRQCGASGFVVGVNVSPRQFRQPGFVARVRTLLEQAGITADALQIEITEGLLLHHEPEVLASLEALVDLGVRIAMDDFGTGYSSLSYLRRYPFQVLKIDREFVRDLAEDANDRALVSATVLMGRQLGLTVVAEGVENEAQLECLAEMGCEVAQGYHFGRPVPAGDFEAAWISPLAGYSI